MYEFHLITGALLMSAAVVLAFRNSAGGAVAACAGVWSLRASGGSHVSSRMLLFWAIAVLFVVSINMIRHVPLLVSNRARNFIVGGALAGMATGLAFHQAGAIVGSAVGVTLGAVAYMRLSRQPDSRLVGRWVVAVGLPSVVTMSLVAIGIQDILTR